MLLERIDPFLDEFDALTRRAFGSLQGVGSVQGVGLPIDVIRRSDELVVTVDLPGVPANEIEVSVENHVLTISAERRSHYAESDQVLAQERFEGTISRRVRVPDWVDAEAVTAEHGDGVLTIRLPLAEQAKARRVPIATSGSRPELST